MSITRAFSFPSVSPNQPSEKRFSRTDSSPLMRSSFDLLDLGLSESASSPRSLSSRKPMYLDSEFLPNEVSQKIDDIMKSMQDFSRVPLERNLGKKDVVHMINTANENMRESSSVIPYDKGRGPCKRTLMSGKDGSHYVFMTRHQSGGDELIGSGGFKKVKPAISLDDGKKHVVATFNKLKFRGREEAISLVRKEIGNLCEFKGKESVVQIRDSVETDKKIYIVMEHCERGDLLDAILSTTKLHQSILWKARVGIALDCARGLQTIHENEMVHRDVKPENFFLYRGNDGETHAKIGDLGFAYKQQDLQEGARRSGSFFWLSPEKARMILSDKPESLPMPQAEDVWSLGAIFYYLFTPKHAALTCQTRALYSSSGEGLKIMESVSQEEVSTQVRNNIPRAVQRLVRSMLDLSPEKRPSIGVVVRALESPTVLGPSGF